MSSFRLKAVRALSFGRFGNESIDGLDHPFVVVHGANESGKSTLTEFLTWITGGPVGSTADSHRFGEPKQTIRGRLLAELNGSTVDIEGVFKVKDNGKPNDDRSGSIGSSTVTAREIAAQLGHLQAADYAFIYRFIGPVLHDTESAENFGGILSQFAIGSAVSDVNPTTVASDLFKKVAGYDSDIKKVAKSIKEIEAAIRDGQKSPARLADVEKELLDIERLLAGIDDAGLVRAREIETYKFAIAAFEANAKLRSLRGEFDSLDAPEESWAEAVKNAADIRREVQAAKDLISSMRDLSQDAGSLVAQVGLTVDEAAERSFSLGDKSRIQIAGDSLKDTINRLSSAQADFDRGAQSCREAMDKVSQAAKNLGVSSHEVLGLSAVIGTWNDLNNAAVSWRDAHARARQAEEVADKADEAAAAARAHLANEEKNSTSAATPASLSGNIPAVIAAVAIVSMIAGAFWRPAILVGAVLVAGVFGRWWMRSRKTGGVGSPAETGSEAGIRVRDLNAQAIEARRKAAEARIDADSARQVFEGRLAPFGIAVPAVELAQDVCTRIKDASDAAVSLADEESRQRGRQSVVDDELAAESGARASFEDVATQYGITYTGELTGLSAWLDTYALAVSKSKELAEFMGRLQATESTLRALFGAAISPDTDLHSDRLMQDLNEHARYAADHDDLKSRIGMAEREARAAAGNNEDVETLLRSTATLAELQERVEVLSGEHKSDRAERDRLIETRNSLETEKSQIENTEFINELNLKKSALEEQLDELNAEKEVVAIAARTLADVINDFQTKNQGPLVTRANQILDAVVPGYGDLVYTTDESGKPVIERVSDSARLRTSKLSTGSRALAYLALRLAFVEADRAKRGVALPILCDDPLVHVDDRRAPEVVKILAQASESNQVVLFTCHDDTRDLAVEAGARLVSL